MLSALQNDLVTIAFAFLSHGQEYLELYASFDALGFQLLHVSVNTKFIDGPHSGGRDTEGNKLTRFRYEELLLLNVRNETALRLPVRVGNVIAANWLLTREFANFGHRIMSCGPKALEQKSRPKSAFSDANSSLPKSSLHP